MASNTQNGKFQHTSRNKLNICVGENDQKVPVNPCFILNPKLYNLEVSIVAEIRLKADNPL